jgi:predicted dinucleotide-binding enzyme
MMKIGILGAGVVGINLAKALVAAGHEVMLSSRTPQTEDMLLRIASIGGNTQAGTVEQTVAFGDVIVVAIGWQNGLEATLKSISDWSGKVLVDTTNRLGGKYERSAGEDIAHITGVPVLKAFNTIGAEHFVKPKIGDTTLTMVVCGDDAAKDKALALVSDVGFTPIDLGGLDQCHLVEALAAVWIRLAYQLGYGRDIALHILQK